MLSLKVMLVLVFILLSIKDATLAHITTTHDQASAAIKRKIGVDEAENGIAKLGEEEVYDGYYVPASIQVIIGRGRKEMEEGNMMSKEDSKNSVATKWERKMRMLQSKLSYGKVNRATLMAFTAADYHMPTTHPPRNN